MDIIPQLVCRIILFVLVLPILGLDLAGGISTAVQIALCINVFALFVLCASTCVYSSYRQFLPDRCERLIRHLIGSLGLWVTPKSSLVPPAATPIAHIIDYLMVVSIEICCLVAISIFYPNLLVLHSVAGTLCAAVILVSASRLIVAFDD